MVPSESVRRTGRNGNECRSSPGCHALSSGVQPPHPARWLALLGPYASPPRLCDARRRATAWAVRSGNGCGGRDRTGDLVVMSHASYRCSTPHHATSAWPRPRSNVPAYNATTTEGQGQPRSFATTCRTCRARRRRPERTSLARHTALRAGNGVPASASRCTQHVTQHAQSAD